MDAKHLKHLRRSIAREPRVLRGLVLASMLLMILTALAGSFTFGFASAILNAIYPASQLRDELLLAVIVLSAPVVCVALIFLITRHTTDAIINRRLADRHCPWRNYDLGGIDADHCPECGKPNSF